MPTCVIFNPTARGNRARHFREQLANLGGDCAFKPTTGPGTAAGLAEEAVREGFETVVAAGGDGTVNEVVNGLAQAPGGLEKSRLGVIPLGTINVFAKELRIPARIKQAWQVVCAGVERTVDLPYVEFTTLNGQMSRRYFAQLAGAGLDARAIELVNWEQKKRLGPLAYVLAGFKAWNETPASILAESPGHQARGALVLIGNGRFYGGRLPVFPQARLDDGKFDVAVFPRITWATVFRWVWSATTGRPAAARDAISWQASELSLKAANRVPVEVEGDFAGLLPARVGMMPRALRVVVPRVP